MYTSVFKVGEKEFKSKGNGGLSFHRKLLGVINMYFFRCKMISSQMLRHEEKILKILPEPLLLQGPIIAQNLHSSSAAKTKDKAFDLPSFLVACCSLRQV